MAPTATAAAEPAGPPGVRAVSHGLRVPRGSVAAKFRSSADDHGPPRAAPRRCTVALAAETPNSGEPFWVSVSMVSMMSPDADRHAIDRRSGGLPERQP
jgi:hypothetical protein